MPDSVQTPQRAGKKCANCGLVNAAGDEQCRRCAAPLEAAATAASITAEPTSAKKTGRGLLKRVAWVLGATLVILFLWYASLLLTSDGLAPDQRAKVRNAITVLEGQGFGREAFVLKYLASFRTTDNWLNAYVGHRDAYAATNFPFEIVTLYPDFFELPIDDRERAAVLLHEARHLLGDAENAALEFSWKNKKQLGWTADKYHQTRVWDATQRLTRTEFPYLFQCGADGQTDCF